MKVEGKKRVGGRVMAVGFWGDGEVMSGGGRQAASLRYGRLSVGATGGGGAMADGWGIGGETGTAQRAVPTKFGVELVARRDNNERT